MLPLIFNAITSASSVALIFSILLLIRSLLNFSRTGPEIRKEIQGKFFNYCIYALLRLVCWSFLISFYFTLPGSLLSALWYSSINPSYLFIIQSLAGLLSFTLITGRQLLHILLNNPAIIATSANFNTIRLYPIWNKLTPLNLKIFDFFILSIFIAPGLFLLSRFALNQHWDAFFVLSFISLLYILPLYWLFLNKELDPVHPKMNHDLPNILMIGTDTLRADHMGAYGYLRPTTPFIDTLVKTSTLFKHCYVPLARTAPSLLSIFTGCLPNKHGIKDNFVSDKQAQSMDLPALAACLQQSGYQTSTISDWAGGDLGKFKLGFQHKNLPEDQWNLKYLIRQGPKDIRLFLSLFCHNKFGKIFLPELYYLAGIPLTQNLGLETRHELAKLANDERPFMLNLFMGTTHPPFCSNYPYYNLFSDPDYVGRSKFCMSRLTSPEEIIKSQQEPREAFDLDQIIALYDGSIRQFDDEVHKIYDYVESCGLADNTIIVIYSDHGMELFENDTWGQGNSIAGDTSAHIPLIVYNPKNKKPVVIKEKIRSIDIMPTLLDMCDVDIPDTVEGVSLKPFMEDKVHDTNLPIYYETGIWLSPPPKQISGHITYPNIFNLLEIADQNSGTLSINPEYMEMIESARDWFIWVGPWKLKCYALTDGPYYELFNTDIDPLYKKDVASTQYQKINELLKYRDIVLKLKASEK